MIEPILQRREFVDAPPVLLDIGASGGLHPDWNILAPYAHCLAFEPDSRERNRIETMKSRFKQLFVMDAVVTAGQKAETDFYLTRSPFCSSTLKPRTESLKHWAFADLFDVVEKTRFKSVSLPKVLRKFGIGWVDWFKTDSQGTDLRLFASLPLSVRRTVLAAEFEPGILDAYEGEDRLDEVLSHLRNEGFWLSDFRIEGSQRFAARVVKKEFNSPVRKYFAHIHKTSPGWGELTFLRDLGGLSRRPKRDLLLMCVIGLIKKQYGFVWEVAELGAMEFQDPLFGQIQDDALRRTKGKVWRLPLVLAKRAIDKLLRATE
ncbi:MAG: hypothetical protein WBD36_00905 [Bacteroidota bacterium]